MKTFGTSNPASSRNTPATDARPDLAVRLRQCAAIFTRAACLLASDQTYPGWQNPDGTWRMCRFRGLTMSGLIRKVRDELYPDARKKVPDGEPREGAVPLAFALIQQNPIDQNPPVGGLVAAARKLREWADFEESVLKRAKCDEAYKQSAQAMMAKIGADGWGALPSTKPERAPAHYTPFCRNGSWIFTLPYGISDRYPTEEVAKLHAERTREEDVLARETTERLRSEPQEQPQQEVVA